MSVTVARPQCGRVCSRLCRKARSGASAPLAAAVLLAAVGLVLPPLLAADEPSMRTGRYEITRSAPTRAQLDPLVARIQLQLPTEIVTIGQAVESLLWGTGYRLHRHSPHLHLLLKRPLAASQRLLGPISVRGALQTLAGPQWDLVEDPLHRLISFEVMSPWRGVLTQKRGSGSGEAGTGADAGIATGPPGRELPRMYRVRPGSLRANIARLVKLWGWKLVGWEETLGGSHGVDGSAPDWRVHSQWMLSMASLQEGLERLLVPHNLRAVLHQSDGTVSVYAAQYP